MRYYVAFFIALFIQGCTASQEQPHLATFYVDSEHKTYISAKVDGKIIYGAETTPDNLPFKKDVEITHGDSLTLRSTIDSTIKAKTEIRINGESVDGTPIDIEAQCPGCRKIYYVFYW